MSVTAPLAAATREDDTQHRRWLGMALILAPFLLLLVLRPWLPDALVVAPKAWTVPFVDWINAECESGFVAQLAVTHYESDHRHAELVSSRFDHQRTIRAASVDSDSVNQIHRFRFDVMSDR